MEDSHDFALAMLETSKSIGNDLTKPLLQSAVVMREAVSSNFDYRSGPDGMAWPERKDNKPHPLLEETGALRAAATEDGAGHIERIEGNELQFGVSPSGSSEGGIPGAGVHNFGYPEKNIPQREFLGVSEEHEEAIGEIFADWLVEEIV
jgi:phage gpG-like protein